MKKRWNFCVVRPLLVAAIISSVAVAAAGFDAAGQGSFDRTLAVTGPVELEVSTGAGNITISPGSSRAVHVHGVIKPNHNWLFGPSGNAEAAIHQLETNPPIIQDGNFIRVGRINDPDLQRHVSIDYVIETPASTQSKAASGSGNVSVSGINGPVKATTGSGNLKIGDIGSDLTATTGSGDIRAGSVKGEVHLSTGSGNVQALDVGNAFYVSTGSGDVTVRDDNGGSGKVSTGSGNVRLSGVNGSLRVGTGSGDITAQGRAAGDWSLRSGSGGVVIRLPADANFNLDAHANSGRIITNRTVAVHGTVHKGTLTGVVGKGGPQILVRTGSGDIKID
ncbi:MAG: DUF4097 family beta strand repeat protein [Acidobacteriota bacterium]|nr:DUF4097 family beta strand repeat protein [Acidobacteriota bacterium]